jgi:hypothetical protein
MLDQLGLAPWNLSTLFCENYSTIEIFRNPMNHQKTKHNKVWMHYIQKHHVQGEFVRVFVPSIDLLVDIFTKSLLKPT